MAKKSFRPQSATNRKASKPWSWSSLMLIGAFLCLVLSFLIPEDFSSFHLTNKKEKTSTKKKKNVLSINLNKTIERSAKAIKAKDFDRAVKLSTRAVEEYPDSWISWLNLGIAKRYGEGVSGIEPAIRALTKAAELNPELPEIHIYLASALACTSYENLARSSAFKALSMSPNNIEALIIACKVTNFTNFTDNGAIPVYDKIIKLLQLHESSTDEDEDGKDDINRLSASQEANLRFALYKILDENNDYSKAAKQLLIGNNVKQYLQLQLLALEGGGVPSWGKESSSALLGEILSAFDVSNYEAIESGDDGGKVAKPSIPLAMSLGSEKSINKKNNYCENLLLKAKKKNKKNQKKNKKKKNGGIDDEDGENEDEEDDDDDDDDEKGIVTNEYENFVNPLVFIGMPRAGSSLLQQMLSAHPNILPGDEYNFFSASIQLAIQDVMAKSGESRLSMADQVSVLSSNVEAIQDVHLKYLSLLQSDVQIEARHIRNQQKKKQSSSSSESMTSLFQQLFTPTKQQNDEHIGDQNKNEDDDKDDGPLYVIDKQMSNTWWAGALPSCSKVIMLKRHHLDLGFSNFKTNFPMGGYEYTNNQTELGWRIALTERLLELWEKIIPSENLKIIQYEDLVSEPEKVIKSILSFLNLNYNHTCITPELTKGIITTPSSSNVRIPIEIQRLKSIKHWEYYASTMEEFIYAYSDAKKWISYVMDAKGVIDDDGKEGMDASPQGWLKRGALFDELSMKAQVEETQGEEAKDTDVEESKSQKLKVNGGLYETVAENVAVQTTESVMTESVMTESDGEVSNDAL